MIHILKQFLNEHFDGLVLRPPLFYLWEYGIRFEISNPDLALGEEANLQQIYKRCTEIFNKVFDVNDQILLVTNVYYEKGSTFLQKRPLNVYRKYIKYKQGLNKLQHTILASVFLNDDDGEDYKGEVTHLFVLPCKKTDIRYVQLLSAISYEDFYHPSCILKGFPRNGYDIFFVNLTKKIVYHLYDDRGCDVIAADKENIHSLYQEYNEWILDYDRQKIDGLFK